MKLGTMNLGTVNLGTVTAFRNYLIVSKSIVKFPNWKWCLFVNDDVSKFESWVSNLISLFPSQTVFTTLYWLYYWLRFQVQKFSFQYAFPTLYSYFQVKFVLSFVSKLTRIEPFKIEPKCFAEQFKDDTCHKKVTIEMLQVWKMSPIGYFRRNFKETRCIYLLRF